MDTLIAIVWYISVGFLLTFVCVITAPVHIKLLVDLYLCLLNVMSSKRREEFKRRVREQLTAAREQIAKLQADGASLSADDSMIQSIPDGSGAYMEEIPL